MITSTCCCGAFCVVGVFYDNINMLLWCLVWCILCSSGSFMIASTFCCGVLCGVFCVVGGLL